MISEPTYPLIAHVKYVVSKILLRADFNLGETHYSTLMFLFRLKSKRGSTAYQTALPTFPSDKVKIIPIQ